MGENMKIELTQDLLKELLHYDPESGDFVWKERDTKWFKSKQSYSRWNNKFKNTKAGCTHTNDKGKDYIHIKVFAKQFMAHRLAFLYVYGYLPLLQIDHIDGDGTNNKINNLTEASNQQNQRNVKIQINNTSGFTGVCWDKQHNKWAANIGVNGKTKKLGRFLSIDDAINARKDANLKYGFHENHGSKREL